MIPVSFTVSCWYYGIKSLHQVWCDVLVVKSFTKHVAPFYQWIYVLAGMNMKAIQLNTEMVILYLA